MKYFHCLGLRRCTILILPVQQEHEVLRDVLKYVNLFQVFRFMSLFSTSILNFNIKNID